MMLAGPLLQQYFTNYLIAQRRLSPQTLASYRDTFRLLLQFVPRAPERARVPDLDPGDAPEGVEKHVVAEDDAWIEGRSLVATVEDVELIDPNVSAERLLYRLFQEQGVRVFRDRSLAAVCSCSRENVSNMLKTFSKDDRDHMIENGKITVTCEFCSSTYQFEPNEIADPTQLS